MLARAIAVVVVSITIGGQPDLCAAEIEFASDPELLLLLDRWSARVDSLELLRKASAIARKQKKHQDYRTERVLLLIGKSFHDGIASTVE